MRSRTTFKKRQKELARQEKQRDKAARRVQRKLEKSNAATGNGSTEDGVLDLDAELDHESEQDHDTEQDHETEQDHDSEPDHGSEGE